MDYHSLFTQLVSQFPKLSIFENHPLAPYTTLKIGGPADIFIHTKNNAQFIEVLRFLQQVSANSEAANFPITILGNGSNVLISDSGIRGIVIKNSDNSIEIIDTALAAIDFHHSYTQRQENEPEKYLDFTKLDYDESQNPQVLVKISSGTSLPIAINSLISQGITGLQWFAYIPGTIGGATWHNIHGGAYHFADHLESAEVFDFHTGQTQIIFKKDLDWSYEHSFFQQNPHLVILSVTLRLFRGDATMATHVRDAWIDQKAKVQPMNSAGSAFANPSLADSVKNWGEQKSAGWIIDHELGWKGKQIGGAQISLQHSNFIINQDHATATDYFALLMAIQFEVKTRFGISLIPEVKLLGQF